MSKQPEALPELPTPALFSHELLNPEQMPNGVHLGVAERRVCQQAFEAGETSEEIREWFTADQMRAYARAALAALAEPAPDLVYALQYARNLIGPDSVLDAAIAKATKEQQA